MWGLEARPLRQPLLVESRRRRRWSEAGLYVLIGAAACGALVDSAVRHIAQEIEAVTIAQAHETETEHDAGDILPVCAFIHGAGMPDILPPTRNHEEYWGTLHERLSPVCQARVFIHTDTLHAGWQDQGAQENVCSFVRYVTVVANATGARLVVFAHSLGNLLLAGALQSSLCMLPEAAAWYSVAAPWRGSLAADRLPAICSGSPAVVGSLLRALAKRERFCEGEGGAPSSGFESLATTNIAALANVAPWRARVNGSMCGDSPFGLWTPDTLGMQALADFSHFGEANDGAVPVAGCHASEYATPNRQHESSHYTAAVNHNDLACKHGDGSWGGDDRMPCRWYAAMAIRSVLPT